jgi:hypothetical protein
MNNKSNINIIGTYPNTLSEGDFTITITNSKLKIDISIDTLVNAFNFYPDNFEQAEVYPNKNKQFAELIGQALLDSVDSERDQNYIATMFDNVFEQILEGNIDTEDIIDFKNHEED